MLGSHGASYKLVEILNGHSTLSVLSVYDLFCVVITSIVIVHQ